MNRPLPASQETGGPPPGASPNPLFPVFLKPEQLRVLLVGGGAGALETLRALLRSSPATPVTVVAPRLLPDVRALAAAHPRVQLLERPFQDDDLAGHNLVFVATNDAALNHHIKAGADELGRLAHVAGAADAGDFHLSAVVEKGDLKIAISTTGKSPAEARRLRRLLEEARPEELDAVLQQLTLLRSHRGNFGRNATAPDAATARLAPGPAYETPATAYWRRIATGSLVTFAGFILLNILSYYLTWPQVVGVLTSSTTFYTFVAVGFVAQLIDGLLGMGYGVVAAISLMSLGLSPAAVSASIHTAEMFASGASGYHHYRFGNVNKRLFKVLLFPGIAGAVSGAFLLSYYGEQYASWVKPLLAIYLLGLGARILSRAFQKSRQRRKVKNAGWLAGAGGFLDSFGGGGWGPLVTSTLIANGRTPQYVIGTVSVTEFFVTFASAFTFFAMLGIQHWQIVLGLIVGGVAAAPLAARLAGRIPTRWMFVGVGLMVILWSLWALRKVFLQ